VSVAVLLHIYIYMCVYIYIYSLVLRLPEDGDLSLEHVGGFVCVFCVCVCV
jgi:hypothetical protein